MNLENVDTLPPKDKIKDEVLQKTEVYLKELSVIQEKLFAQKKCSVFILLQGVDTS
ncbi:polyphosphate kinase, partial [Leptospira bandrabouensis]|nr:polyphosphate kinase [Leptospira bandrabouensis]